jgi:hypothetical protein
MWFPNNFYSSTKSNPIYIIAIEKMVNDKKIHCFAIEKSSQHMIALASQIYTAFNDDSIVNLKFTNVCFKQTKHLLIFTSVRRLVQHQE